MKYAVLAYVPIQEKLLMMKKGTRENDPNSTYNTAPGGKIELYEMGFNPVGRLEAVVREIKQETGLILLNPIWRGVVLFDNENRIFPGNKRMDNYTVYAFYADMFKGKMKKGTEEGIPCLVDTKDISNLPQNPGDPLMYEWIKDGRFFVGVIKYDAESVNEAETWVDFV